MAAPASSTTAMPGRDACDRAPPGRVVAFGGTLFNFWTMAAAADYLMSVWDSRGWVAHCVSGGTVAGLAVACDVRPTELLRAMQESVEAETAGSSLERAPRAVDPALLRGTVDRRRQVCHRLINL